MTEADDEIELREILGPAGLMTGKNLGRGEILKVLMVRDHVDRNTRTLDRKSVV